MDRPPLPGNSEQNSRPVLPDKNSSLEAGSQGETTQRVSGVLNRRFLPKASWFIPGPVKRKVQREYNSLPQDAKEKISFLLGIGQWVFLVVFGLLFLGFLITVITSSTIIEPKTAQAVLNKVPETKQVFYTTEIVRTKNIDGAQTRQDQVIKVGTDLEKRKYQVEAQGIEDDVFRIIGDGKSALYQKGANVPGKLSTYPSLQDLQPLLASDINKTKTQLITNQMTVQGKRGWLLTWTPTKETLEKMMNKNLIGASGPDIDAIASGNFKAKSGTVTLFRDTKRIYQVLAVIQVNGAEITVLNTYRDYNNDVLSNISFQEAADE